MFIKGSIQTSNSESESVEIPSFNNPKQKQIMKIQEEIEKELEKDNRGRNSDDQNQIDGINQNNINQDYNQLDRIHQKLLDLEQMAQMENDGQYDPSKQNQKVFNDIKAYMNRKRKHNSFDIFDSQMINRLMFKNIAFYTQNQKEIEYQFILGPGQKKRLYKDIKDYNSSMFFMVYSFDQQLENTNYSRSEMELELKVSSMDDKDSTNNDSQKCNKKFWGAMHCEIAVSNCSYQIEISNQASFSQIVSLIGFKDYESKETKQQVEGKKQQKEQQYREVYTQQMTRKEQIRIIAIIMRYIKNEMLKMRVQKSIVQQYVGQTIKDNSRNKRRYVRYSVIEMLLYLVFMLLQIRFIQNVLNNKPVI